MSTLLTLPSPVGVFYADNYALNSNPMSGSVAVAGITSPTALDCAYAAAVAYQQKTSLGCTIELGAQTYPVKSKLVQPTPLSFGGCISIKGQGRYATIIEYVGAPVDAVIGTAGPKPPNNWPSFRLEGFTVNCNKIALAAGNFAWWINGGGEDIDCVNVGPNSPYNWKIGDPTTGNAQELRFVGLYASDPSSAIGIESYCSDSDFIAAYPGGQAIGIQQKWGNSKYYGAHPTGCATGIYTDQNSVFFGTELDTISGKGFDIGGGMPSIFGTNPTNMGENSVIYFFGNSSTPQATILGTLPINEAAGTNTVNCIETTSGVWPPNTPAGTAIDVAGNPIYTSTGVLLGGGVSKGAQITVTVN